MRVAIGVVSGFLLSGSTALAQEQDNASGQATPSIADVVQDLEHDGSFVVDPIDGVEKAHLVNRESELRTYVAEDGAFTLVNRLDTNIRVELHLDGEETVAATIGDDQLSQEGTTTTQMWLNSGIGIEHVITLHTVELDENRVAHVSLRVSGMTVARTAEDAASFIDSSGAVRFIYKNLYVFDGNQRQQAAIFDTPADDVLNIDVFMDDDAVLPLTIDPLATTASTPISGTALSRFGASMAVGDLNGDGFNDLAVGSPAFDNGATDTGRVVVFGGSASGLVTSSTIATFDPTSANFLCGESVGFGDFDHDSDLDVVFGCVGESGNEGRLRVHFNTSMSFNTTPDKTLRDPSSTSSTKFGRSRNVGIGDINGDTFADIVTFGPSGLQVFDLSDGSNLADTTLGLSGLGLGTPMGMGLLRNFNGDAATDVAVFFAETNLRIFTGKTSGAFLSTANFVNKTVTDISTPVSSFIITVTIVGGDYDGDGDTDVALGRVLGDGDVDGGRVDIFDNSSTTLTSNANSPVTGTNGSGGLSGTGFFIGDGLGGNMAMVDLNDDGHDELILCSPGFGDAVNSPIDSEGKCEVFRGGPTSKFSGGLDPVVMLTALGSAASPIGGTAPIGGDFSNERSRDLLLGRQTGATIDVFNGTRAGLSTTNFVFDDSGDNFAALGTFMLVDRVDNDTKMDLLVGAPSFDGGAAASGAVFGYLGATSMSSTPSWTQLGTQAGEHFGSAIAVGRFRGDGLARSIVIGAPDFDSTGLTDNGQIRIYTATTTDFPADNVATSQTPFGGQFSGDHFGASLANTGYMITTTGDSLAVGAPGTTSGGYVVLYKPNTSTNVVQFHATLTGTTNGCSGAYGKFVANAGNVDGLNQTDLLVSAPDCNSGSSNEGKVFLYFSASGGGTPTTPAGFTTEGNQVDAHLGPVAGIGDFNDDGIDDFAVGAPGFTNGAVVNAGYLRVFKGVSGGTPVSVIWPTTAFAGHCGSSITQGHAVGGGTFIGNDFNLDGIDDVAEGEPTFSDSVGTPDEGRLRVFFGAKTPDSSPDFTLEGGASNHKLGTGIAAGEMNGDQQGDLAFGRPGFTGTQSGEGRFEVFIGRW